MKLQLTDNNFKKLERVLSIKKRVQRYRFVILIILFFVVIPILFLKIFATTTDNRNWFIGLSALGLILILKQFPHLIGYDANFEGDETFKQGNDENTFSGIVHAFRFITPVAILIGVIGLLFLSYHGVFCRAQVLFLL